MVSASCPPPCALLFALAPEPPAAADPSFFSVEAEAPALPDAVSAGFSVLALELPLADGVLLLPLALPLADGVLVLPEALPDALPWASVLDFCSWLIDGVWPVCDSCFFSCATPPNDSNAAATATAIGLNLMKAPFLGNRSVYCSAK
jgi:hypothetical protein